MIVVGIIGILAALAIPNFIRYQLRSKSTEAKTVMGGIRIAEETFRAELDEYVAAGPNPNTLPEGTKASWVDVPCPVACRRTALDQCTSFNCIGFEPRSPVYYQYQTSIIQSSPANPAEYSAGARSDLDSDGVFGSYTLRSANAVGAWVSALPDGLSSCDAAPIPAAELFDCAPNTY